MICQKLFWGIAFLFVLNICSCSNYSKDQLAVFSSFNETMEASAKVAKGNAKMGYLQLEDKVANPATAERGKLWKPVADIIRDHTSDVYNYIDSLRAELKTNAGYISDNEKFDGGNTKIVANIFNNNDKVKTLFYKLKNFKPFVLSCDTEVGRALKNTISILPTSFDSTADENDFLVMYLNNKPVIEVLAFLSQFQNNICMTENQVVTFLNNQSSGGCILRYEKFAAIVALSSKYVKQGDRIDVSAGVGSFSTAAAPKIRINGNYVLLDENGVANYRLKAANEPGKHIVPVKIDYTKPDGTRTSESLSLEYVVSKDVAY